MDKKHIENKMKPLYTENAFTTCLNCIAYELCAGLERRYQHKQHEGNELFDRVQNNQHVDARFTESAIRWAALRALHQDYNVSSFRERYRNTANSCDAIRHLHMEPKKSVDQQISPYLWTFHPAARYDHELSEESLIDCAQAARTNKRVYDTFITYAQYYRYKI